jgi:hypothetical protein
LTYFLHVDAQAEPVKNFDASGNDGAPVNCLVCERLIPEDTWFARFKVADCPVLFCKPRCVEIFLDNRERYTWRIKDQTSRLPVFPEEPMANAKEHSPTRDQVQEEGPFTLTPEAVLPVHPF